MWLQKGAGQWTIDGGAGYEVNHAAGMQDSWFGGSLLQRALGPRLTLGAEVFTQQAQEVGARGSTFVNAGGYYFFTPALQLLFMAGHSARGEAHTIGYLGLYYTWGP